MNVKSVVKSYQDQQHYLDICCHILTNGITNANYVRNLLKVHAN